MKVYIHAPAISISGIPSEYVWKKDLSGLSDGTERDKGKEICKGVYS